MTPALPRDPRHGPPASSDDWVDPEALSRQQARLPWFSDRRLIADAHTHARIGLPSFRSVGEWEQRKACLRRRILLSAGLWPLPERTDLRPEVRAVVERDGYAIENVCFQSFPGFSVTANLYRPSPLPRAGRLPAVLKPHGHFPRGRFEQGAIADHPRQAANLVLRGCVVLMPAMAGYGDSRQIYHHLFDEPAGWLWGATVFGVQLWSSMRCLDYLCGLPYVDPQRIACTGESGGGTQTFFLAAVDERVRVSIPVNMVSARFQGGCTCENAPGLRFGTGNVEIAAMAAPRPQLVVSCTGDWTSETPSVELPAMRRIYALYGAEAALEGYHVDAGHNYNRESREAVYAFLARHLGSRVLPAEEVPTPGESEERLSVFAPGASPPAGALDAAGVRAWFVDRALQWLRGADGTDRLVRLQETLAIRSPAPGVVHADRQLGVRLDGATMELFLVRCDDFGSCFPATLFSPPREIGRPVLLVHPKGRTAWLRPAADRREFVPGPLVRALLGEGRRVMVFDAFLTGEYANCLSVSGRPISDPHFLCFAKTDDAWRVQDVVDASEALAAIAGADGVDVIGEAEAGLWCLLARPFAPRIGRVAADWASFASRDDGEYLRRLFIPGLRSAGDVEGAIVLAAPAPLLVHDTRGRLDAEAIRPPYRAAGRDRHLVVRRARVGRRALLAWLGGG